MSATTQVTSLQAWGGAGWEGSKVLWETGHLGPGSSRSPAFPASAPHCSAALRVSRVSAGLDGSSRAQDAKPPPHPGSSRVAAAPMLIVGALAGGGQRHREHVGHGSACVSPAESLPGRNSLLDQKCAFFLLTEDGQGLTQGHQQIPGRAKPT